MKKLKLWINIVLMLIITQGLFAQSDTILFDFGAQLTASTEPWNNMTDVAGAGQIAQLKNTRNLYTTMGVNVYDRFTGINESGTTTPDAGLGLPSRATRDNYYGNVAEWAGLIEPTAGIQITGLDTAKQFTFEIFASRMGVSDNRETKYKFNGLTVDSVYLDAANNTNTSVTTTLKPGEDGTIDLVVAPGENNTNSYNFYYLGALKMIYEQEAALPAEISLNEPNGDEVWLAESSQIISWNSINLIDSINISYSTDNGISWTPIQTVGSSQKSIQWIVPNEYSYQCLISVTSDTASDVSNDVFSIVDPTTQILSLTSPVGGENWIIGESKNITWNSNNLSDSIHIEFSTDNGSSWESIATVEKTEITYLWIVPNITSSQCLVRVTSGTNTDVCLTNFTTLEAACTNTIVVLGSSTAYGTGPSPIDSSWVNRYSAALTSVNSDFNVVNLALGGYTSYQILPTGTPVDSEINESIDVNRNITKALSYSPYAVIVNMPSNDANKYYSVENQIKNFNRIVDTANTYGVKVWIATSQPRNFSDPIQIQG